MKIKLRVFGRYKDIVGKEHLELTITQGNTLQEIINEFVKQYPQTEKDKKRMMITINNLFASYETTFQQGDEITVAPPVVSGG
jgi:MoaE-MoaD fusion protein